MSVYLKTIRAKMVAIKCGGGTLHANKVETLHTNFTGMYTEGDSVPPAHRLLQARAAKYWEGRGLPNYVISGDNLYRWTGDSCFWIDTDRIPGEFLGIVTDGVLAPHSCANSGRVLEKRGITFKVVCADGYCRKVLEAKPGEVDALVTQRDMGRVAERQRQARRDAIWAKAREAIKVAQGLDRKADDARASVKYWEDRVAALERELGQAKGSLTTVIGNVEKARYASTDAWDTAKRLERIAGAEAAQLDAVDTAPATDC